MRRGATLSRGKTLSRPDRFQTPETMFKKRKENEPASCWVVCSRITTCWALPPFMRMCGIHEKAVQQAWREKVTLCVIIMFIGGMVAFLTIGFSSILCPADQRLGGQSFLRYESPAGMSYLILILFMLLPAQEHTCGDPNTTRMTDGATVIRYKDKHTDTQEKETDEEKSTDTQAGNNKGKRSRIMQKEVMKREGEMNGGKGTQT